MLSLRSLCLLKVSSLKLSYEASEIPSTLTDELKKMQLFNGNFCGQEVIFFLEDTMEGFIEHQGLTEYVLTIQYQGEGTWALGICYKCDTCNGMCDGEGRCGKQPEKLQFVLEEKKTCDSDAVFDILRGLRRFGSNKRKVSKQVTTVLSVVNGNGPDSGLLVFSTTRVLVTGKERIAKFQVNSTLDDSPVFKYSVTYGDLTWGGPLVLTECQVTAMEAFPEPVTECGYIEEEGDIDGDLTDSDEENEEEEGADIY
eukprot:GFUD01016370.1.p1 GENE.GFUD01016370.1~~GFUD01016370.1.p1  ORF type:complete len:255 (-),score=65.98 GFUD01016370.1:55-819(-)